MTRFLFALGLILFAAPALAHEWYPYDCCSDNDCAPIPLAETPKEGGGGFNLIDGRHIAYAAVRASPDGRWHLCEQKTPANTSLRKILCIFGPIGGS